MPLGVKISFRNLDPSPAAEAQVRRRAAELDQFFDRIGNCNVTIGLAHRHHRQGRPYHVRIDLALPGSRILVNRDSGANHAHEDLSVALRDAFDAARRQLQDHVRRLDGLEKRPLVAAA